MFSLFKLFENKENTFSYENQTKTNFENKENEFTIFNILYMNQKIVLCCLSCFRIKLKTRDLVDWDKTKTRDCGYFLIFFPFRLPLRFSSHQAHENTYYLYFKLIFIVFINFIFKKMVLQNGFSYSLFSTKFKYETYFLKMKTKD